MKGSKKLGIIIGVFLFLLLMVGATYAYWVWRGNVASVSVTPGVPFECSADGGVHASTVALAPAACTHSRFAIQREITVNHELFSPNTAVYMDMVLTVDEIGAGLAASSNFKYALTTVPNSCTDNVIVSGTFTNKSNGTKISLLEHEPFNYVGTEVTNKYYLYIWIDAVEENPDVLVQDFEFSLSLDCTQGEYWSGATYLVSKANDGNVTTYIDGNTAEMYTFSQPETVQVAATTDYRYIGPNPNNYITFNDETWRIIGVFDGRIKIVKDSSIGNISWDYKKTGIGSSVSDYGSNDWVDSQLMYMLNPNDIATNVALKIGYTHDDTYVYDANGMVIYQKGCKPALTDGTSYSCAANTWSLNSTALSQIADVTYYLGGSNTNALSALSSYMFERGDAKYNDMASVSWLGKVGLVYLSDYLYTFAYGVDTTCYDNFQNCKTDNGGIPSSSWLYSSLKEQWTLGISSNSYGVKPILKTGDVGNYVSFSNFAIRPIVYLKSNIELDGSGTNADPYVIVS